MPRRPRIELAGYHHIYSRAVESKYILQNYKDKDKFLDMKISVRSLISIF